MSETEAEAQARRRRERDAVIDDLADEIEARAHARALARPGYVHEVDSHNCHCNADDCEHCVARSKRQTEIILAAHEKLYPAIREAQELAELGSPTGAARALKAAQAKIDSLTDAVGKLTGMLGAILERAEAKTDERTESAPPK